ncbi:SLC13 family permease [Candidatus Sulfidibacterium hydrothermale]|uniref:SLC13 family permease n=1 Tax=Candidatus Sulfidibacterium hydrothermale TaxID=2875962 RepID=UPI001F0A0F7E|nr:SLC13 family permease [Candidatus Sulfidibacterium hydrothermale]UBM61998.1 SLC13 family permease [Candidatus Sulfidibacterium hydrothermale]
MTKNLQDKIRVLGFVLGLLLFFFILFFVHLDPEKPAATATLAVAMLMAVWWVFEVVPLAVTALLPVFLYPLLGIMNGKAVSSVYFNDIIFLFIGGFMVALAMQRWSLHRRIALRILMLTGTSPSKILLGFMLATAFLSMWISNTATTMMMIPILLSIIEELEDTMDKKSADRFTVGLLLGVAYSASIGGVSTLVGTPPNPMFTKVFAIMFPKGPEISFATWFFFAFPLAVLLFLVTWVYLYRLYRPAKASLQTIDKRSFYEQYHLMGKLSQEERIVLADFVLMALLWMTRSNISIGGFTLHGWSNWFAHPHYFNDGTVAIFMASLLYFIPSKSQKGDRIMNWEFSKKIPWGIVLLFGGGFALAIGFKNSGLSAWFGHSLTFVNGTHPFWVIMLVSFIMVMLTELTSNTATTQILLPILAGLAVSLKIDPLFLMIPATISASMAFMLPVATPPNAIVFGSNKISVAQMAKTGFVLNIIATILITLFTYFLAPGIFHIHMGTFPGWAQ